MFFFAVFLLVFFFEGFATADIRLLFFLVVVFFVTFFLALVFLELEDIDGKNYKIKAAFTHTSVVDVILQSDNYFTDLFGIGNLRTKYPNITEEVWNMISRGKVRKGMTTDECRLALGNPMRIHIVTGGYETWSYERKTLDFTNKKLDRIH